MNAGKAVHGRTTHGLTTLKRTVMALGGRVIDRRTAVGKALDQWRSDPLRDLRGSEEVSTRKLALIDLAVRTKLMPDSIDNWILTQSSLINAQGGNLRDPLIKQQSPRDSSRNGPQLDEGQVRA